MIIYINSCLLFYLRHSQLEPGLCKCPHCENHFAMSNLTRHIKIVHSNESTECPQCGKTMTSINLTKYIKSLHNKLKRTCSICTVKFPYSFIQAHKRKTHHLGKPIDNETPRDPNFKLSKTYRQMLTRGEDFDKLTEHIVFEDIELEKEEDGIDSK